MTVHICSNCSTRQPSTGNMSLDRDFQVCCRMYTGITELVCCNIEPDNIPELVQSPHGRDWLSACANASQRRYRPVSIRLEEQMQQYPRFLRNSCRWQRLISEQVSSGRRCHQHCMSDMNVSSNGHHASVYELQIGGIEGGLSCTANSSLGLHEWVAAALRWPD